MEHDCQTVELVQADTLYGLGLYQLGLHILTNELRMASRVFLHAVTHAYEAKHIQQSLAFVQGSSLEILMDTYGITLDATRLRETFFEWGAHYQQSASSSATIKAVPSLPAALPV